MLESWVLTSFSQAPVTETLMLPGVMAIPCALPWPESAIGYTPLTSIVTGRLPPV
ncbi:hypothetical protein F11_00990 [Rhodospirillum rubrum F11]|nr:hypothetical protein F11_00990 [Rhodospirillum rubrum F11]